MLEQPIRVIFLTYMRRRLEGSQWEPTSPSNSGQTTKLQAWCCDAYQYNLTNANRMQHVWKIKRKKKSSWSRVFSESTLRYRERWSCRPPPAVPPLLHYCLPYHSSVPAGRPCTVPELTAGHYRPRFNEVQQLQKHVCLR